jgi:anaphase-promoting complex subunit 3
MAPTNPSVINQLRQLIHYHIDNNLLKNAQFYAERLAAYGHRSAESAYLLALCHLRLGDNASAYEYAKPLGREEHIWGVPMSSHRHVWLWKGIRMA